MKRSFRFIVVSAFLLSVLSFGMAAQDLAGKNLLLVIHDAKTRDPISYASAYLIPQGDTTITNFTLSDTKGQAAFSALIPQKYQVHVEMVGYKPFMQVCNIPANYMILLTVALEESMEYIDAATVTAKGYRASVQKDTLVYNASSYKVAEDAMLEDLLRKMPGMKVDPNGSVSINGEQVDRITVGGKTFFFNDPALAVKNLPAKIVEKIKVFDQKKTNAEFTGIATKDDKEKVMDVQLKEEYRSGWFGNTKLYGGANAITKETREQKRLSDPLYSASGLVAGYNEKNQVTFVGRGESVSTSENNIAFGRDVVIKNGEGLVADNSKLLPKTIAQAGINYNTSLIKGFDSNASLTYKFSHNNSAEKIERTSFLPESADMATTGEDIIGSYLRVFNASFKLDKKDNSKYLISIQPSFIYTSADHNSSNSYFNQKSGLQISNSSSSVFIHTDTFNPIFNMSLGIKDIGKERRSIVLKELFQTNILNNNRLESFSTQHSGSSDSGDFQYDESVKSLSSETELSYSEPIGSLFDLQVRCKEIFSKSSIDNIAHNVSDGSIANRLTYDFQSIENNVYEQLLLHFKKGPSDALAGVQANQEQLVTTSRQAGVTTVSGQGQWNINWSPFAEFSYTKETSSIRFNYKGVSPYPDLSYHTPSLDLSNPIQVTAGNIYLRTPFYHNSRLHFSKLDFKRSIYISADALVDLKSRPVVYASWFNSDGDRFAIPVNSTNPGVYADASILLDSELKSNNNFGLALVATLRYSSDTSYQATSTLPGLDKDNFDYGKLMSWFWGNQQGDLFYSGKSGFAQSQRRLYFAFLGARGRYEDDKLAAHIETSVMLRKVDYSLNSNANRNTADIKIQSEIIYETSHNWKFQTLAYWTKYLGYGNGLDDNEFIWNFNISKSFKNIGLHLIVHDVFNQQKYILRTISDEYMEDRSRINVLGRNILFGITYNFGNANYSNDDRASSFYRELSRNKK